MAESRDLKLVITSKNEASKALNDVSKDLDNVKKTNEGMTASVFKGVASWDLLKQGVSFVKDALVNAYNSAKEAEINQQALNSVLASTGGVAGMTAQSVNDLASSLASMTNFEDDAILKAENMLLTFTNVGQEVFPQATEAILNMATAMNSGVTPSAESLKGTAIQLGKALNDPITGMTALRKVGVSLSETQQEQIKSFVEVGDIASAQKIVLNELEREFGNLAKNTADPMKQAKNQLGEIGEAIGGYVMPYVRQLGEWAYRVFTSIVDWLKADAEGANIVGKVFASVVNVLKLLGSVVWLVGNAFFDFGKTMVNAGKVAFSLAKDMWSNFKKLGDGLRAVFKAVGQAIKGDFDGAKDSLNSIKDFSFENTTQSMEAFRSTSNGTTNAIQGVADAFKGLIQFEGIEMAKMKTDSLAGAFTGLGETMVGGAGKASEELGDAFKKLGETIQSVVDSSETALDEVGKKIVDIKDKMNNLIGENRVGQMEVGKSVGEAIVNQEKKIADLTLEIGKEEDAYKKQILLEELERERLALESKKTWEMVYQQEIAEARRRASLTEFERLFEDLAMKKAILEDEFNIKIASLQNELALEMEKEKKLIELQAFALAEANKFLAKGEKQTLDSVNREISYYNQLAKAIANAKAGKTTAGLSITADQNNRANAKNTAVNINITGNTIAGAGGVKDLANLIGRSLTSQLGLTVKL